MRLVSIKSAPAFLGLFALCTALVGCPEKGGGGADKASAEPEHAEPDDQGKLDEKAKKPAAAAPAAAPAPAPGEEKKEKDEGGW
jgi:hypothetical protein